ncbi:MAG: iron-sulfur cluster biosynthesis family protein [Elusimicrobiales bacterium]|nr:iron-sulfur cluster biosynthesis family protein [Elusimicrobiales bacterium]
MLEITDGAIEKLKGFIAKQGENSRLRIFMAPGCCGPSLAMDITTKAEKEDAEMEIKSFKFYVAKDAAPLLENAVIDCDKDGSIMVKGLPKQGGDSCGCGDDGCGDDCGCGHDH